MANQMRVLQHQQLSPEAYQVAGAYQLGIPQEEFKIRYTPKLIISGSIVLALGIFFGIATFAILQDGSGTETMFILLPFTLLFLIIGAYSLLKPALYSSRRVYLCSNGFAYTHGGKTDIYPWQHIDAMWQQVTRRYYNGIYTGTTHKYTIRRSDGAQLILNDIFPDVELIGNRIAQEITRCLLPRAITSYNAGQTITFGKLSVNMQGVSNGREMLPWNQIKGINVNRGIVSVKKEGKILNWSTVQVAHVPNIFVFMALVNYILKGLNRQ